MVLDLCGSLSSIKAKTEGVEEMHRFRKVCRWLGTS